MPTLQPFTVLSSTDRHLVRARFTASGHLCVQELSVQHEKTFTTEETAALLALLQGSLDPHTLTEMLLGPPIPAPRITATDF